MKDESEARRLIDAAMRGVRVIECPRCDGHGHNLRGICPRCRGCGASTTSELEVPQ